MQAITSPKDQRQLIAKQQQQTVTHADEEARRREGSVQCQLSKVFAMMTVVSPARTDDGASAMVMMDQQSKTNNPLSMFSGPQPILTESPFALRYDSAFPEVVNKPSEVDSPAKEAKIQVISENKVGALEQENMHLKSQIEVLRAALFDLCHEKNMPFTVLTQAVQNVEVMTPSQPVEQHKCKDIDPTITIAQVSPAKDPQILTKKIQSGEKKRSPRKVQPPCTNVQRRRRSQRKGSSSVTPTREQPKIADPLSLVHQSVTTLNHSILAETPLGQNQGNETLLVVSPTVDEIQVCSQTFPPFVGDSVVQSSPFQDAKVSNDQISSAQVMQTPKNASSIQKSLPSLSRRSHSRGHSSQFQHSRQASNFTAQAQTDPLVISKPTIDQAIKEKRSPSRYVATNLVSSTTSKYYEHQITNLKSELEVFEEEERKIIDLLSQKHQLPNSSHHQHSKSIQHQESSCYIPLSDLINASTGRINQTALNSNTKQENKLQDSEDMKSLNTGKERATPFNIQSGVGQNIQVQADGAAYSITELAENERRFIEDLPSVRTQHEISQIPDAPSGSQSHSQMLKNLEEVFTFIQQSSRKPSAETLQNPQYSILHNQDLDSKDFMKPIKIRSPRFEQVTSSAVKKPLTNIEDKLQQYEVQNLLEDREITMAACSSSLIGINTHRQLSRLLLADNEKEDVLLWSQRCGMGQLNPATQSQQNLQGCWENSNEIEELRVAALGSVPAKLGNQQVYAEPTPHINPYLMEESATSGNLRILRQSYNFEAIGPIASNFQQTPKNDGLSQIDISRRQPSHRDSPQNSSEKKLTRKVDRSESIRRAEEMLTQFLKESTSQHSKRPDFLKNRRNLNNSQILEELEASHSQLNIKSNESMSSIMKKRAQLSENECGFKETDKVTKVQEAINNISFQQKASDIQEIKCCQDQSAWFSPYPVPEALQVQKQAEKPNTPKITSPEATKTSYYDCDLINLQINPDNSRGAPVYQVEMQTQNFKSFDHSHPTFFGSVTSSTQSHTHKNQFDDSFGNVSRSRMPGPHGKNQQQKTQPMKQPYLEPKIIKKATPSRKEPRVIYSRCGIESTSVAQSFDNRLRQRQTSKSPQGSAQKPKKLTTAHKVKKSALSGNGEETPSQTKMEKGLNSERAGMSQRSSTAMRQPTVSLNKEYHDEIKTFIQISGETPINTRLPGKQLWQSKSPSKTSLNPAITSSNQQPQKKLGVEANTSLISNAIFLARQLQNLSQPFSTDPIQCASSSNQTKTYPKQPNERGSLTKKNQGFVRPQSSGSSASKIGIQKNFMISHRETPTVLPSDSSQFGCQTKPTGRSISGNNRKTPARPMTSLNQRDSKTQSIGNGQQNTQERPQFRSFIGNNQRTQTATPSNYNSNLSSNQHPRAFITNMQNSKTPKQQQSTISNTKSCTKISASKVSAVKRPSTAVLPLDQPQNVNRAELDLTANERKFAQRAVKNGMPQKNQSLKQPTVRQHQVKEYYQLKREHDKLRFIMQQTAQDLSQTGIITQSQGRYPAVYIQKQINKTTPGRKGKPDCSPSKTSTPGGKEANGIVVRTFNNGNLDNIPTYQRRTDTTQTLLQKNNVCENCLRLKSEGLSSRFCLDHSQEYLTKPATAQNQNAQEIKHLQTINSDLMLVENQGSSVNIASGGAPYSSTFFGQEKTTITPHNYF